MNLAQLIAAVYTETNRPDLVPETLQAVLEATMSIHTYDDFYKDIQEASVVFDNSALYLQQLDTTSFPGYRKMAYLRKTSPIITSVEQGNALLPATNSYPPNQFAFLTRVDIGDIIDSYGYEKVDIWYQAGSGVNIKSSTPLQYVTAGWYKYPVIDATGVLYSSWVAREFPYAIIYRAAGVVFSKIGQDVAAALYLRQPGPRMGLDSGGLYYQQLGRLIQSNLMAS